MASATLHPTLSQDLVCVGAPTGHPSLTQSSSPLPPVFSQIPLREETLLWGTFQRHSDARYGPGLGSPVPAPCHSELLGGGP